MVLERIKQLNAEAQREILFEKLSLIDDYFKAKKLLVGLGVMVHKDYYDRAGSIFDTLYDLNSDDILLELSYLHGEIAMFYKSLAGLDNTTLLKP
jgi:hypothetical protein